LHERDAEYKLLGMPDCVTLLTKFGSVGCLLVGIALTISQPIVSDPQQRAARKESNVRFISPDGMFAFEYPKSLIRCETDPKQADRWTPARSCEAVIPVCAYASLTKDATVVCIAYPAETLIGTNFEAAAFSVNKLDETTADECLRVTEPHPATSHKEKVNGVTLDVFDVGGVAAGSVLVADAYRKFHQNRCYELDLRIAFANIGAFDPGTVKEFDYKDVHRSLKSVLNTFTFLK
jgi:hypothetical protein